MTPKYLHPGAKGVMKEQERTEEKINLPEPPDGSIVGWGHPIRAVHVRIDEYEDPNNEHGEHWFLADDDAAADADPLSWDALLRYRKADGEPYLLERREGRPS